MRKLLHADNIQHSTAESLIVSTYVCGLQRTLSGGYRAGGGTAKQSSCQQFVSALSAVLGAAEQAHAVYCVSMQLNFLLPSTTLRASSKRNSQDTETAAVHGIQDLASVLDTIWQDEGQGPASISTAE